MDVQLIDCKLIDLPKSENGSRPVNKEFAKELAPSLKTEGMYNPIVLRPNPAAAGRYLMVQGRQRYYSWWKILKNTHIPAFVFVDMDDQDAEMAEVTENLYRNPLTTKQHLLAVKKWFDYFAAKNPSKVGSGGARNFKKEDDSEVTEAKPTNSLELAETEPTDKLAETTESEPEDKKEEEGTSEATGGFATMYAKSTNKSETTGGKITAIVKAFNAEQIEALDQMQVTQLDQTSIARIKDSEKRGQIVNLIASGVEVADAVKQIMGDDNSVLKSNKSKAEAEAKKEAKAETHAELSDDAWYEFFCGEKAAMFSKPEKYKSDAILYRITSESRHAMRGKHKKVLAETRKAGPTGPLWNLVNRITSLAHPKDWLICEKCKGTGDSPTGGTCEKCFSSCYALKTENFI